eukprot:961913-Prymnesium_polylepis.2
MGDGHRVYLARGCAATPRPGDAAGTRSTLVLRTRYTLFRSHISPPSQNARGPERREAQNAYSNTAVFYETRNHRHSLCSSAAHLNRATPGACDFVKIIVKSGGTGGGNGRDSAGCCERRGVRGSLSWRSARVAPGAWAR